MSSSMETVNAAAAAIASAETRVQQVTVPRRRWNSFFSLHSCFGSHCHSKRITNAVFIPEPAPQQVTAPPPENSSHPPALVLPFIAPPSSPVSFMYSGPPSATQSPAGGISLSTLSTDIFSPGGRPSIFAIGPYANETQLVSPPIFSTFTTEPSTAPFTPPPESVQFTTPSSPEVPFAKLLTSLNSNYKKSKPYEFHSPSSVCSGTSSPFPDREFHSLKIGSFPIPMGGPVFHELVPRHASRVSDSLLDGHIPALNPTGNATSYSQGNEPVMDHRVSFELTAEEVTRCLGRKSVLSRESASEFPVVAGAKFSIVTEQGKADDSHDSVSFDEAYKGSPEKARTSITLSAVKEFKFSNSGGISTEPSMGSDWWVNKKAVGMANTSQKNWAFFPMIQPGVS